VDTALSIVRGVACVALTGLGLLVLLRTDGSGAQLLAASALIGLGLMLAAAGTFLTSVVGGGPPRPRRRGG
jgi:hypothetical protein